MKRRLLQLKPARTPGRMGFTLLEVLLTLFLSTLLLLTMTMAIDVHLHAVDSSRLEVEQAQLARAVLGRMADDLRAAVCHNADPNQDSGGLGNLQDMADDLVGELSGLEGESAIPEGMAAEAEGRLGSLDGMDSEYEDDSESWETPLGLYGDSNWMQVDVSRLPRLDQYNYTSLPTDDDTLVADRVSDVKTVAYFLNFPDQSGLGDSVRGRPLAGGLMRRELDRHVTQYADQRGMLEEMHRDLEPFAPEIVEVYFSYHDGVEWAESWDSDELGGLPLAVRIAIVIAPADQRDELLSSVMSGGTSLLDDGQGKVYYLIVHLPGAELLSSSGSGASDLDGQESGLGGQL